MALQNRELSSGPKSNQCNCLILSFKLVALVNLLLELCPFRYEFVTFINIIFILGENETLPHMPLLLVLSQTGLLTIFNVINLKKDAPALCTPPQQFALPGTSMTRYGFGSYVLMLLLVFLYYKFDVQYKCQHTHICIQYMYIALPFENDIKVSHV